ncbi:Hypothetical predicted protein [Cloeon dipterum]|uniref:BTB domain-containing protein n=1 Tax=Cloeon dipterum TaxID=197152 RepID=A0A8S1E7W7_9INSE|nr:Hypothetical predicted protein [Cloeon dipterum]
MSKLLVKWANFGYQRREIRTAIVFGTNAENVIIVLENDDVLAFGKNQNGCLGAGVQGEVKELKSIQILCKQRIEGFEFGSHAGDDGKFSFFAISACGSVFSWGDNFYGQLGLRTTEYIKVPTKISGLLEQTRVVQVAYGGGHTLALTSEGEVYTFGRNNEGQLGLGTTENQPFPRKVGGLLEGTIVASVACQALSSIVLLHSGKICVWGFNTNGMLGIPSTLNHQERCPCMVIGLESVVISKIACGTYITLALSDDGKIYSWGLTVNSQSGNRTYVKKPSIISAVMKGRIKDIAATRFKNHPCAAITENNQVYIWGNCNGIFKSPTLTSVSSLDEVFAVASPPITYQRFQMKMTRIGRKRKGSVIDRFQEAFDVPETADFVFIVEGEKIHVHKNLLIIGSDVFKKKFLGNWEDSCKKEQIVEDHSYKAFYAFLKYFYTDQVDIKPEIAIDVYSLAHFYQVTDLMNECEKILKSGLTVQIAAAVYEKAILFRAKDLCEFCIKFCKEHWLEVMDIFESDDSKRELILEVFRLAANQKKN